MENPRYYADEAKAARMPLIHERLEMLEKVIEEHRELHAQLTEKLAPISRQEPTLATGGVTREKEGNMSPLALRIDNLRERLSDVAGMYRGLMNRLEL